MTKNVAEDDPDELEALGHEYLARAARARVARRRPAAVLSARLLTRKMYVAQFGSADGWSALESAAQRGEIIGHRLGRAKSFLEEDVLKIAATREPRRVAKREAASDETSPRAAYLSLVGSETR